MEVLAVSREVDPRGVKEKGMAFAAPPGARTASLERMWRDHPVLYAARHVALAVKQVSMGFLGIGALIGALLSALPPHVPLPEVPLRWINLPVIPWPAIDLPDRTSRCPISMSWRCWKNSEEWSTGSCPSWLLS